MQPLVNPHGAILKITYPEINTTLLAITFIESAWLLDDAVDTLPPSRWFAWARQKSYHTCNRPDFILWGLYGKKARDGMKRLLMAMACVCFIAGPLWADDLSDEIKKKFGDLNLSDLNPNIGKDKPAGDKPGDKPPVGNQEQGTAVSPGDSLSASGALPADVVELVWPMIDKDKNGRATDREVFAAIKKLRVYANKKDVTPLQESVQHLANVDGDPTISPDEAIGLLAKVRGERCPTAARAKQYFDRVDRDRSLTLAPQEFAAALTPLGTVGRVMERPLALSLKQIDLDNDNKLTLDECYFSANSLLRVQLATEGDRIASRRPDDWMRMVGAVASLDIDADNVISPLEAIRAQTLLRSFQQIDGNKDRQITASELCDYQSELDLAAWRASSL